MSNDNFPKDFENETFEFLWNSIIHKVKKTPSIYFRGIYNDRLQGIYNSTKIHMDQENVAFKK